MAIQLKKTHFTRKRFLKMNRLLNPSEWMNDYHQVKEFIREKSHFQLVGSKIYFEISEESDFPSMLLEVIGPPVPKESMPKDLSLELFDQESSFVYIHKVTDVDLFHTDFAQLVKRGRALSQVLLTSESKEVPPLLNASFRIAFDNEKIELHFFSQKDYIQK
jgi:hypothetical protein